MIFEIAPHIEKRDATTPSGVTLDETDRETLDAADWNGLLDAYRYIEEGEADATLEARAASVTKLLTVGVLVFPNPDNSTRLVRVTPLGRRLSKVA